MGLCKHRNKESQDPDEVTVTCFRGRKKGKKSTGICSDILTETEGLIHDLRKEIVELRQAQTGKHDESRKLEETVTRLMDDKERLMEERGRLREELTCLRMETNNLEQRTERLSTENQELSKELKERSRDLNSSFESACKKTKMVGELESECRDTKTSLMKAKEQIEHITDQLRDVQAKYETGQIEVERLSKELSNLELTNMMAEKTALAKSAAAKKKYVELKRICRGKDGLIHQLKEEKSKALMQLWQTTYGRAPQLFTSQQSEVSRSKQPPLAAVEPFHNDVITVLSARSPVKDVDHLSPDFLKNKTMSMELELYRKRKMAEIFGSDSLSMADDDTSTFHGDDVRDDMSDGVSDFVDSFLECVVDKRDTCPSLASVSSEMIL